MIIAVVKYDYCFPSPEGMMKFVARLIRMVLKKSKSTSEKVKKVLPPEALPMLGGEFLPFVSHMRPQSSK